MTDKKMLVLISDLQTMHNTLNVLEKDFNAKEYIKCEDILPIIRMMNTTISRYIERNNANEKLKILYCNAKEMQIAGDTNEYKRIMNEYNIIKERISEK